MKSIIAILLASTLFSAIAAEQGKTGVLQDINGKVLVNQGKGLTSGKLGTDLKEGDRIVTLNKSGARISFNDGCMVSLQENQIFVIDSKLGCKAPILGSAGAPAITGTPFANWGGEKLIIGSALLGTGLIVGNNPQDNHPISGQ